MLVIVDYFAMTSEIPKIPRVDRSSFQRGLSVWVALPFAVLLGLLVAAFDLAAPFGDDTANVTIVLLAASSGVVGFLQPRRPRRWGIAVGMWLPTPHAVNYLAGWGHPINPNYLPAYVLLLAVSIAISMGGSYAGALVRKAIALSGTSG